MDQSQACVYLYRNPRNNQILYVGRGKTPERATQHLSGSHNPGLAAQISEGDYTLEIAGPYPDQGDAALVEAALISALHLPSTQANITNLAAGHGIKFRPFGVPSEFAGRALQPPLTLAEVGTLTGGALIVRNSFGGDLEESRPRLDPVSPDQDDVVADNICRHWLLERLVPAWEEDPQSRPRVVLGAAGPIKHRYVPGAFHIDRDRLGQDPVREVPVHAERGLDAHELRGRLLLDARFGQNRTQHFIWVDAQGRVRHPASR